VIDLLEHLSALSTATLANLAPAFRVLFLEREQTAVRTRMHRSRIQNNEANAAAGTGNVVGDERLSYYAVRKKGKHAAMCRAKNAIPNLAAIDGQRPLHEWVFVHTSSRLRIRLMSEKALPQI
jgi:hypothetical protein